MLIPGDAAPKLITKDMLALMEPGTVLVDVAIDQGGCFETSHPTKHSDPVYTIDGIVHYAVANIHWPTKDGSRPAAMTRLCSKV